MIRAIIFDLDNTLIDFLRYKKVCCDAAIKALISSGLDIDKKKATKELYRLYKIYGMEDHTIFQKLLRNLSGSVDYRRLSIAINAYRKARVLTPYPNTIKTLRSLKRKGIRLAIVTDAPKLKAYLRLTAMGIDNLFDVVITRSNQKANKPFMSAVKKLGIKPEECMVVGDSISRDIKGAKAIGMMSCFAKYGYVGKKKVKANYTLRSISDLLRIL